MTINTIKKYKVMIMNYCTKKWDVAKIIKDWNSEDAIFDYRKDAKFFVHTAMLLSWWTISMKILLINK